MRHENSKAVLVAVDIGELLSMKFPLSAADKKKYTDRAENSEKLAREKNMAHENSITVPSKRGKRWVNIPTVMGGRQLTPRAAEKQYGTGVIKPLGGKTYETAPEAVKAAKKRSRGYKKR